MAAVRYSKFQLRAPKLYFPDSTAAAVPPSRWGALSWTTKATFSVRQIPEVLEVAVPSSKPGRAATQKRSIPSPAAAMEPIPQRGCFRTRTATSTAPQNLVGSTGTAPCSNSQSKEVPRLQLRPGGATYTRDRSLQVVPDLITNITQFPFLSCPVRRDT